MHFTRLSMEGQGESKDGGSVLGAPLSRALTAVGGQRQAASMEAH